MDVGQGLSCLDLGPTHQSEDPEEAELDRNCCHLLCFFWSSDRFRIGCTRNGLVARRTDGHH